MNDVWEICNDREFAGTVFGELAKYRAPQPSTIAHELCNHCKSLDLWTASFVHKVSVAELKERSGVCYFCRILYRSCEREGYGPSNDLYLERTDSILRIKPSGPAILSICGTPELQAAVPYAQVGFPRLPEAGSWANFEVMRLWLQDCDTNENHHKCQLNRRGILPTRVIDVGTQTDAPTVRLYETTNGEEGRYIALSHPWGYGPHFYRTLRSNIESHKERIELHTLPKTFRDAITATRELGVRYIWIDSLCIVQGPDGDWGEESKRMEDVYSSAYCVISASRALGQEDGFLQKRRSRDWITFHQKPNPPFFICQAIDDFNGDVLKSPMNRRGWVLQERVLARRTIYFAESQTYWECGQGVRCETLTKMVNHEASFLGDPKFPEVAMKTTRGGKIALYESLYKQYSRLQFTRPEDRPIAISGLEKRLISAFQAGGGYGLFDSVGLFQRGLLWRRGSDENSLRRIIFPVDSTINVPTWSWMAYIGGIDYMKPPDYGVDWEVEELRSPWAPKTDQHWHTGDRRGKIDIHGVARDFNSPDEHEGKLIFDIPGKTERQNMKCIVLGRHKEGRAMSEKRHYVLVVGLRPSSNEVCERLGVGYMPGRCIVMDRPGLKVRVR